MEAKTPSLVEKYRLAKSKLRKATKELISRYTDNETNTEDSREEPDAKKAKKNRNRKYLGLFTAGLAVAVVAVSIVGATGGLAKPLVFAALGLEVALAAFDIRRAIRDIRKERKERKKNQEKNKTLELDKSLSEENSVATEKTVSDTLSLSSDDGSINSIEKNEKQPLSWLSKFTENRNLKAHESTRRHSKNTSKKRNKDTRLSF